MAPFTFDMCPRCSVETRQRYVTRDADGEISLICETCFTVLTYREEVPVECRAATGEERALVPPVWTEQEWAEWRESLLEGQASVRAWFQAGCPGLTPEL